ncbi:MAG: hypothetical protein Q8Q20_00510 [bacterium]|nr:hypothetical protein [bacterium]
MNNSAVILTLGIFALLLMPFVYIVAKRREGARAAQIYVIRIIITYLFSVWVMSDFAPDNLFSQVFGPIILMIVMYWLTDLWLEQSRKK